MKFYEFIPKKGVAGSKRILGYVQDGIYSSSVWVNHGETITPTRAEHKTFAGAKKWAMKKLGTNLLEVKVS